MIRHIVRKRGFGGGAAARRRAAEGPSSRGLSWAGQLGLVVCGFALAACAPEADPLAPPVIHYGEDVCDACMMIISEERHAAATIVDVDGASEARRFDDIGDLLSYHAEQPELEVLAWYVHDYETLEWLDALTAIYVISEDLVTPMGHGIVAFGDLQRAEAFAAEHAGEVKDFDALLALNSASAGAPHNHVSKTLVREKTSNHADNEEDEG